MRTPTLETHYPELPRLLGTLDAAFGAQWASKGPVPLGELQFQGDRDSAPGEELNDRISALEGEERAAAYAAWATEQRVPQMIRRLRAHALRVGISDLEAGFLARQALAMSHLARGMGLDERPFNATLAAKAALGGQPAPQVTEAQVEAAVREMELSLQAFVPAYRIGSGQEAFHKAAETVPEFAPVGNIDLPRLEALKDSYFDHLEEVFAGIPLMAGLLDDVNVRNCKLKLGDFNFNAYATYQGGEAHQGTVQFRRAFLEGLHRSNLDFALEHELQHHVQSVTFDALYREGRLSPLMYYMIMCVPSLSIVEGLAENASVIRREFVADESQDPRLVRSARARLAVKHLCGAWRAAQVRAGTNLLVVAGRLSSNWLYKPESVPPLIRGMEYPPAFFQMANPQYPEGSHRVLSGIRQYGLEKALPVFYGFHGSVDNVNVGELLEQHAG